MENPLTAFTLGSAFSRTAELRNIYHHHPESKKRKSSEENSGFVHPYGRYGNAVKTRRTISTIAILWPVKAMFEKRAATVEVDTFIFLGQKSCRTKVPRIFRIFVPNFAPNVAPNFPRIFRGVFVLRFVGNGDQKKFTKNPRLFSIQNSQANTRKIFTNVSGEQAK